MYHSDKEDYDSEVPNSAKFPRIKNNKKFDRIKTIDEDYSSNQRSGQHSEKTEESTDFTSSFSRKAAIQDCQDLKNLVKNSVENIQDLINTKLYSKMHDKFEIINEEKEEEVKRPATNCGNIIVKKKMIDSHYLSSQKFQSNYSNSNTISSQQALNSSFTTHTQNNTQNLMSQNKDPNKKSKTRNLSAQKKLDSFVTSTKAKLKPKVSVTNCRNNTKPSSKSDLLDVNIGISKRDQNNFNLTQSHNDKAFYSKITNNHSVNQSKMLDSKQKVFSLVKAKKKYTNPNPNSNPLGKSNISRNISLEKKDVSIKKRFARDVSIKQSSKAIQSKDLLNLSTKQPVASNPIIKPSYTSRTSKEKLLSSDKLLGDEMMLDMNKENFMSLINMMKIFNDFSIEKSVNADPLNITISNYLSQMSTLGIKNTINIADLSTPEIKSIVIQRTWRRYKIRKILNMQNYYPSYVIDSVLKRELYNSLAVNDLFNNFMNMMNSTIRTFKVLCDKNGKLYI